MIFKLNKSLTFPNPKYGEEDGLLAIGGDLSLDRLLLAYSYGIFPWYAYKEGVIEWWCPMKRFVIFPQKIHISHSMRTLLNKNRYMVTFNQNFDSVIHNCAALRDQMEGAWLGPEMIKAYTNLHTNGFAISVEVWDTQTTYEEGNEKDTFNDKHHKLVGGLYGVTIGKCLFGESMFSLIPSASKIALIKLCEFMTQKGGTMIDCQFETSHLKSMGGEYITYDEYMKYVKEAHN
jgi:leucyl/phenylalanyl-tRNA--protein transferase